MDQQDRKSVSSSRGQSRSGSIADSSGELGASDLSLHNKSTESKDGGKKKQRSTIITVQMVSKKGNIGDKKINTVEVQAVTKTRSREQSFDERDGDSTRSRASSSSSSISDIVPKKIQKIGGTLETPDSYPDSRRPINTSSPNVKPHPDFALDVSLDSLYGASLTPQSDLSGVGLLSSASDTNLRDNVFTKSPSFESVSSDKNIPVTTKSLENIHRNKGLSTGASESNIRYRRKYKYRHSDSGSYEVMHETGGSKASDMLWQKLEKRRTISFSASEVQHPKDEELDDGQNLQKDATWASTPFLEKQVENCVYKQCTCMRIKVF